MSLGKLLAFLCHNLSSLSGDNNNAYFRGSCEMKWINNWESLSIIVQHLLVYILGVKEGRSQHNELNLGKPVENSYFGGCGKLIKLDLKYADYLCEML